MAGSVRFDGEEGRRRLVDLLGRTTIAAGNRDICERLAEVGELRALAAGDLLIAAGGDDTDLFIILAGRVGIDVKGVRVNHRGVGDHVGEISAADPSQPRSADVVVVEDGTALKVSEPELHRLAVAQPDIWRRMLVQANQRLVQRNALVRPANAIPSVFIICSVEALDVARALQVALSHDEMLVTVWTDGVFRASEYPLESLVAAVSDSDFAIAVIHGDDVVRSRRRQAMAPRDNVTFELGLFMGHLGRDRTLLVEPRGEEIKLASDLRGLTTVSYRTGRADQLDARLAPTAHEIRKHIDRVGVRR